MGSGTCAQWAHFCQDGKNSEQPRQSRAGFTLLEVLIAVAIMTVAYGAIVIAQSTALNSSYRAQQMSVGAMLAKNAMSQTEHEIEGKEFNDLRKEEAGAFEKPYEKFRWKREIKEVKFPSLPIGGGGGAGEDKGSDNNDPSQEMVAKVITKFLSESIREVVVTVSWPLTKGTGEFKLSTYWVNLNHEFSLSQ